MTHDHNVGYFNIDKEGISITKDAICAAFKNELEQIKNLWEDRKRAEVLFASPIERSLLETTKEYCKGPTGDMSLEEHREQVDEIEEMKAEIKAADIQSATKSLLVRSLCTRIEAEMVVRYSAILARKDGSYAEDRSEASQKHRKILTAYETVYETNYEALAELCNAFDAWAMGPSDVVYHVLKRPIYNMPRARRNAIPALAVPARLDAALVEFFDDRKIKRALRTLLESDYGRYCDPSLPAPAFFRMLGNVDGTFSIRAPYQSSRRILFGKVVADWKTN